MSHHFALPLRLAPDGRFVALTEGSTGEIAQSVQVLLATRVGERRSEPSYGSADPLFGAVAATTSPSAALTAGGVIDTGAIAVWEPRAAGVVDVTATSTW